MSDDAVLVLEIGNEREHFEAAFPRLEVVWLDTSAGDDQVLLLTARRAERRRDRAAGRGNPGKHPASPGTSSLAWSAPGLLPACAFCSQFAIRRSALATIH